MEFCHELGLDYVSCSPYRLPIARLAAAQAALREVAAKPKAKARPARTAKRARVNGALHGPTKLAKARRARARA